MKLERDSHCHIALFSDEDIFKYGDILILNDEVEVKVITSLMEGGKPFYMVVVNLNDVQKLLDSKEIKVKRKEDE